jgi:hypothetical protein
MAAVTLVAAAYRTSEQQHAAETLNILLDWKNPPSK